MYRINIKSPGKYHNVVPGYRYCFRKKTAKNLIDLFSKCEANFTVEKFVRLTADIFGWTDDDEGDRVFDYYFDRQNKDDE